MEYTIGTRVFNDWEITAEIGEGSYGKVYQLRKENFGIVANGALKVLRIPRSNSDVKDALSQGMDEQSVTGYFKGIVEEFMREVAVMSDMKSHPNIVGCQDYAIVAHEGSMGWDILIRMDLLTPLQSWQIDHPMDEAEVRRLGIDLCEALVHCQQRGLIHRDIKPANIFVDDLGRYRLGDFGVARTADKTMGGMSKQGTENYMAPEVYLGKPYGPTVDIYSLGMVLYQLMNGGRLPFYPLPPAPIEFSHRFEVLKKRMGGEQMPPPVHASEDLAAIILKACAFDSANRYRTAAELMEALKGSGKQQPKAAQTMADPIPSTPPSGGFAFAPSAGDETIGPGFAPKAPSADATIGPAFAFTPPAPTAEPAPKAETPKTEEQFSMIVDFWFPADKTDVVVGGSIRQGKVHTGDAIMVRKMNGQQLAAQVVDIVIDQDSVPGAARGDEVLIMLSGLQKGDIANGDVLQGGAQPKAGMGSFRMNIESAFAVPQGLVVTGVVTGGPVHKGDSIIIQRRNGSYRTVQVAGIERYGVIIDSAAPGEGVGILLTGLAVGDAEAGDQLSAGASEIKSAFAQSQPQAQPQRQAEGFSLTIDNAFAIQGRGVVVTGWVIGETIRKGDAITLVCKNGTRYNSKVAGIENNRRLLDFAEPGTAVGILMSDIRLDQVSVGDLLTRRGVAVGTGAVQPQVSNMPFDPEKIFYAVLERHPRITPGKGIYHMDSFDALCSTLGIPAGELVWLCHDDTWLKRGKQGFALTERGIYVKSMGYDTVFITWKQFANGRLTWDEKQPWECQVGGVPVYYCTSGTQEQKTFRAFYEDLHKTMQNALHHK